MLRILSFVVLALASFVKADNHVTHCFTGYVMDDFCINLGTLLDTGDETLRFPDRHSVHCAVDERPCRESGYHILKDLEDGESLYTPVARLDEDGNQMMIEFFRQNGACSTCVDGYNSGQRRGLRATVTGSFTEDGENFIVSTIDQESVACPANLSQEAFVAEDKMNEGDEDDEPENGSGSVANSLLLCLYITVAFIGTMV